MKITVEHCDIEESEIILRCKTIDNEMLHILSLLKSKSQKLYAFKERNELILLSPNDVLYCESVDDRVFLYCKDDVYQSALNLAELETQYINLGFCRISKCMVVNLNRISKLKSCSSGKIEALMQNGEKVIVSRHYSPILRNKLEL